MIPCEKREYEKPKPSYEELSESGEEAEEIPKDKRAEVDLQVL